jgi:hypothetical protein
MFIFWSKEKAINTHKRTEGQYNSPLIVRNIFDKIKENKDL